MKPFNISQSLLQARWRVAAWCLALCAIVAEGHTLYDVDIQVVVNDLGHARVVETRTYDISDTGTEAYIKQYKLGVMSVGELAVSDDTGLQYQRDVRWNEDRSRSEKAGHCGIYSGEGGPELCWGIGDSGRRTYVVRYTLTRMAKAYDDYDGFNFCFYDAGDPFAQHVRVTISLENDSLDYEHTGIWAFGYHGTKHIIGGKIVAETEQELMREHETVTVMVRFDKGVLHPVTTVKGTFKDRLMAKAFEGSDYRIDDVEAYDQARQQDASPGGAGYDPKKSNDTLREMVEGLADVAGIILWVIAPFLLFSGIFSARSNFKRDYQLKRLFGDTKAESQQWFRDVPLQGDLNHARAVLDAVQRSSTSINHQMGAYILRMVNQGLLKVERRIGAKGDNTRAIRVTNPGPPPLEKGRHSEDLVRDLLHRFMWKVAGDDHVLEPNELKQYAEQFPVEHRTYVKQLKRGLNDLPDKKISTVTKQEALEVFGLKKFLQEFTLSSERHIEETSMWQEFLVYATLFGIADQVKKELQKVWPADMRATLDDLLESVATGTILTRSMGRAITYIERYETPQERAERLAREAAEARSSSSGGGGSSSYGGGGGSSGGGGSGIR